MAVQIAPLTGEDRRFLLAFEDDTERAAWMVSNDYHRRAITTVEIPLDHHSIREGLDYR